MWSMPQSVHILIMRAKRSTTDLPEKLLHEIAGNVGSGASEPRPRRSGFRRKVSRKEDRAEKRRSKKQRRLAYSLKRSHSRKDEKNEPVTNRPSLSSKAQVSAEAERVQKPAPKQCALAPWEIDDSDDLDDEIKYLEKKLGIVGASSKKLKQELKDDGLLDLHNAVLDLGEESDDVAEEDLYEGCEGQQRSVVDKSTMRRHKQQFLYGKSLDNGMNETLSTVGGGRYVPPHERTKSSLDDDTAGKQNRLRRVVRGLFNRLSESNIDPITSEIRSLFSNNARMDMSNIISEVVIAVCADGDDVASSVLTSCAASVASLNAQMGPAVGAVILEHIVKALHDRLGHTAKASSANLVILLSNLYSFQMVHSGLIYDLIRVLIDGFQELHIELLALLLKHCGYQLRRDDPAALRDTVMLVQNTSAEFESNNGTDISMSSRFQFMLDTIYELKNNKRKMSDVNEQLVPLRNWLRQRRQSHCSGADPQLRLGWQELLDADQKGRWWIVGSAWRGRDDNASNAPHETRSVQRVSSSTTPLQAALNERTERLEKLARARGFTTDVQRAVFFVLMGADDYMDAFERIVRLDLRSPKDRDACVVAALRFYLPERGPPL